MPGERPKALTPPLIAQLGELMARMHQVSESTGLRCGHGTDLCLFGPDDDNEVNIRSVSRHAIESRASLSGFCPL